MLSERFAKIENKCKKMLEYKKMERGDYQFLY